MPRKSGTSVFGAVKLSASWLQAYKKLTMPSTSRIWPIGSRLPPTILATFGTTIGTTTRHAALTTGISRNVRRQFTPERLPPMKVKMTVASMRIDVKAPIARAR